MRFDSGVSIAVFFYDGPTSRAIAFEGLLNSGEALAARLKAGFKDGTQPQLDERSDRWRILWTSSSARRNGAGIRGAPAGAGQDG